MDGLCPDHTGHGIHVKRRLFQTQQLFDRNIDKPDLGAQEQYPGNGAQNARDDKRDQGHDNENLLKRRIRALADPRQISPDEKSSDADSYGIVEGIQKEQIKLPVEIGFDIVLDREGGAWFSDRGAAEATVNKHGERNAGEV